MRRGFFSAATCVGVLLLAAFPSRLAGAFRGWGTVTSKVERTLVGALVDLCSVAGIVGGIVLVLTLATPLVLSRFRGPKWQRVGAVLWAVPFGAVLWLLTVAAQEVKSERGSFPTVFDLMEGGTNATFMESVLGFLRYERIWFPAAISTTLTAFVIVLTWRRVSEGVSSWPRWALGVAGGFAMSLGAVWLACAVLAALDNRFSTAALGDPMTGLKESAFDFLQHKGPATPRELVLTAELPADAAAEGAARLGWPPAKKGAGHLHQRPLDVSNEPPTADPRGTALVHAFERVGAALFSQDDPAIAVFQLSLEGFRADDVHALNDAAPVEIAPFTSSLYQPQQGVLTSRKMFQAGVRTAHCLGAMTCGLGTLPYNLSFIRDLHPFPVRCASDVLHDAGFHHSFFYGSDITFDDMHLFLKEHGYQSVVSQKDLPKSFPKGTWDGVTDFAVFDEAVERVAEKLPSGPQFAFLMSLSNHSPFTPPEDLPAEVEARVSQALKTAIHRADADDRLRLVTYSYTDAAVERLFKQLEVRAIADRSIVLLMADHSTGHAYVWGAVDPETDAAKSQIPFALVIPPAFLARAKDPVALKAALLEAQKLVDEAPLSQNDVPTLLLALLQAHPSVRALAESSRWHTLGGQVTSPWFKPGGDPASSILGINGVSELFALDRQGKRVGGYEDSVFLKTRADRYRVTPRLIPVTATLVETMKP